MLITYELGEMDKLFVDNDYTDILKSKCFSMQKQTVVVGKIN